MHRVAIELHAQVTYDRILKAAAEPQNWLTYSGTYNSQRYSTLAQITPANVAKLESKWVLQNQVFGAWQSNPLVVDGVMYLTERPNDVMAVDAKTGRDVSGCIAGRRRRMRASAAARTIAASRSSAIRSSWGRSTRISSRSMRRTASRSGTSTVADVKLAYSITLAPLVDQGQGDRRRRRRRVRHPRLHRRVRCRRPARKRGASTRFPGRANRATTAGATTTGSTGGGVGLGHRLVRSRPEPHLLGRRQSRARTGIPLQRPGDNLYSDSVVALDADTGKLKWHFQFTPNDGYDYDSVQVPVLADINWKGTPTKVMMWANRNGFFYVLDRATGQVPARRTVREGELGERTRRERPARFRRRSPPGMPT